MVVNIGQLFLNSRISRGVTRPEVMDKGGGGDKTTSLPTMEVLNQ